MEKSKKKLTNYVLVNGYKIGYRKQGNGTPIVLANRFRGTLDTWDPLFINLLSQTNTVVTFDYVGIGYSEGVLSEDLSIVVHQIKALTDALQLNQFHLLGWSYGGWVVQYFMHMYNENVLKTVIIGSNPVGKNEIPIQAEFFERALKPYNDFDDELVLFYKPTSKQSKKAALISYQRIQEQLDVSKIPNTQEQFQRYFAAAPAVTEDVKNYRSKLITTKTPILVISGDNDISYATENWFPLLNKAKTIQHIILPDSGHAVHFQYPVLSTNYIKVFLMNN